MFGEYHEQQSPSPDRNRFIRINYNNIQDNAHRWYQQSSAEWVKNTGYDLNSPMHYATWMFGNGNGPTFARLFPELHERGGFFYLMSEVSTEHSCPAQCSDTAVTCQNDGYLTKVDNKCSCRCIPGLDPDTGCTTILKADPPGLGFPGGKWAIPAHASGCPDGSFLTGSRTHVNDGGNSKSSDFDLKGQYTADSTETHFCVKDSAPNDFFWPGGNFCVHRKGGECPDGFTDGFVQYDDRADTGTSSGDLPDGVYSEDTRFEYCCQSRGFSGQEMNLPSRKPFVLLHNGQDNCQQVRGMHSRQLHLKVANVKVNDTTLASSGGHNPSKYEERHNRFLTRYCSYTPATIDCGDIFEVNPSNPEVTFSSPIGSELECYWLIKAPAGERLQLDFTTFNIAGSPGSCADELEVRYSRPGQPGRTYCGSSWEKTTISINNTIHLRLSTYGDSESHFTATVKLIQDSELCYEASDRGMTYDGDINFTRDFQPCLPWHEMTHCPHHPFNTDIFNTILMGNKCRNPDPAMGFQPWCYTEKAHCQRNYCDVCLIGSSYDSRGDCAELKAQGFCDLSVCGKTCAAELPVPAPAHQVTCPTPGPAPDGVVVDPKPSYAVGESATYTCNTNNSTRDRLCLSTGQWSPMGQVCSVCTTGWHKKLSTQSCYSPVFAATFFAQAKATCQEYNAIVSTAKSEEESDLPGVQCYSQHG
ncbi:hypothetical protein EGW08_016221 [Elysia chlorotica]|uniref:Metalloendopeptidase n=1 Tax=Elysia chlorotica TaxID=188477 RepID=A0A433T3B0_ELYCH|nr:hypothetical protein EGW08_016221 [Elysia chlorotica]